jgi:hypothetical protein
VLTHADSHKRSALSLKINPEKRHCISNAIGVQLFPSMNLSDEQKQIIAQRLSDGASISDIQRLVTDDFNGSMTFMETRFLIDDLNLDLKEPEVAEEATIE